MAPRLISQPIFFKTVLFMYGWLASQGSRCKGPRLKRERVADAALTPAA
jgi:hypothetical protein